MSKILIVCFTFPPNAGIGGRRWAKFAKYLNRNHHDIQVFAASHAYEKQSPWMPDIQEYKQRIHYLNPGYPKILGSIPQSFVQRWHYRAAYYSQRLIEVKGNYFDRSTRFGKRVRRHLEAFIHKGYNNVIISCGPFHMAREIVKLKSKFPAVNFILDFRDPWANNNTAFGFNTISLDRRQYEYQIEKDTIKAADQVIAVSNKMSRYFQELDPKNPDKYVTIANGFDREDFGLELAITEAKTDGLKFVFSGTLYEQAEHVFVAFCAALNYRLSLGDCAIIFEFYGAVPAWFYKHTAGLEDYIVFGGNLALSDVYSKLAQADACMLFLTDDLTFSRSTKFYEYAALRKPIVVFSTGGDTAEFVVSEGLGFKCDIATMENDLSHVISTLELNTFETNRNFDNSEFDIENISRSIDKLLK